MRIDEGFYLDLASEVDKGASLVDCQVIFLDRTPAVVRARQGLNTILSSFPFLGYSC